jgi:glycosyl hydrolase family 5
VHQRRRPRLGQTGQAAHAGAHLPQATAGTPIALSFDPATGDFSYTYQPADLGVPTEVFISPLHYPGGHTITVIGGTVTGTAPHHRTLIEATGTAPVTVTIRAA